MFSNHDSSEKQDCRDKILSIVDNIKKENIRVLTLPSTNFYLEEALSNIPGVKVDCVERDREVYKKQLDIISERHLNISIKNQDIFEYLKESKIKYDVVWLDLCGPLSPEIISNFLSLVNSRELISDDAYIMLTILCRREQKGQEMMDFYGCTSLRELREQVLVFQVKKMAKEANKTCELLDVYNYSSGKTNIPMKMLSFHLVNN